MRPVAKSPHRVSTTFVYEQLSASAGGKLHNNEPGLLCTNWFKALHTSAVMWMISTQRRRDSPKDDVDSNHAKARISSENDYNGPLEIHRKHSRTHHFSPPRNVADCSKSVKLGADLCRTAWRTEQSSNLGCRRRATNAWHVQL